MRALAIVLLLAGCSPDAPEAASEPLAVEVAQARDQVAGRSIQATGAAAFARETVLSFRVPGVISRISVDVGDSITLGQVLAELVGSDLEARMRERQADLARAERAFERMQRLSGSGVIAGADFDDQRDVVASAQASLTAARYDLASARITAPFAGVILERPTETGQTVSPGAVVLRLGDTSRGMVLHVQVASADAARIAIGDTATADFGEGREQTARIVRIGRDTNRSTGTRHVELALRDSRALASGDMARVTFSAPEASGLIAIPAEAYVPGASGGTVFTLNADRTQVRQTPVRLVRFDGDDALVLGIDAGASVVTAGAGFVRDGQAVRPVRER